MRVIQYIVPYNNEKQKEMENYKQSSVIQQKQSNNKNSSIQQFFFISIANLHTHSHILESYQQCNAMLTKSNSNLYSTDFGILIKILFEIKPSHDEINRQYMYPINYSI